MDKGRVELETKESQQEISGSEIRPHGIMGLNEIHGLDSDPRPQAVLPVQSQ